MDPVDADRTYGIKSDNQSLQILAVLYICFYIFWKCSCFGFTAKRAHFDTEFFVSSDIYLNYRVDYVPRLLNASL